MRHGLSQLLAFVKATDDQVAHTSTKFALGGMAGGGMALVLLPALAVLIAGTSRFPLGDYLITSLIGAVLLVGSAAGFVVDSKRQSKDLDTVLSHGDRHMQQLEAQSDSEQLATGWTVPAQPRPRKEK